MKALVEVWRFLWLAAAVTVLAFQAWRDGGEWDEEVEGL